MVYIANSPSGDLSDKFSAANTSPQFTVVSKCITKNLHRSKTKTTHETNPREPLIFLGAEDGIRTRDPNLGKAKEV